MELMAGVVLLDTGVDSEIKTGSKNLPIKEGLTLNERYKHARRLCLAQMYRLLYWSLPSELDLSLA